MVYNTVASINQEAKKDTMEFIAAAEKSFDSTLESTVDRILENPDCDIVLLAGPSSSGKTTTANKIVEKIKARNRNSFRLSLDDYYFNRNDIPMTDDGIRDFENITALDMELIHKTFKNLIENRCAELPEFDFLSGERSKKTTHIEIGKNDVIVVEGIHALNPIIAAGLGSNHIFKIYISVSSRITDSDGKVVLSKRNLRLVRRMIRDFNHRSCSVEDTFLQWPGVLKGEDKYLFPYEANADVKINSFHSYEPCLFRDDALQLLTQVEENSHCFSQAQDLISKISLFYDIDNELLPKASLLREFVN